MIACYDHRPKHDPQCPDCQFLTEFEIWCPQDVIPLPVFEDGHALELFFDHYANGSTMPDEAPELWSVFKRSFGLPLDLMDGI